MPKSSAPRFTSFWSTASAWGVFSVAPARVELAVTEGFLPLRSITLAPAKTGAASITFNGRRIPHRVETHAGAVTLTLEEDVVIPAAGKIVVV
jgi:hypothetical protein